MSEVQSIVTLRTNSSKSSTKSSLSQDSFFSLDVSDLFKKSTKAADVTPLSAATASFSASTRPDTIAEVPTSLSAKDSVVVAKSAAAKVKTAVQFRPRTNEGGVVSPTRKPRSKSPLRLPKLGRSLTWSPRSTNLNNPPKRAVSFDKVQIREHQQILGEHPCTEVGPSLGLGWSYHEKKDTCLDKYESKRTGKKSSMLSWAGAKNSTPKRKSGVACSLSPTDRTERALRLGYTAEEIWKNQRDNQKVQKRRQKTLKELLSKNEDAIPLIEVARMARGPGGAWIATAIGA